MSLLVWGERGGGRKEVFVLLVGVCVCVKKSGVVTGFFSVRKKVRMTVWRGRVGREDGVTIRACSHADAHTNTRARMHARSREEG